MPAGPFLEGSSWAISREGSSITSLPLDCDASFVVSPIPDMGGRRASYEAWNNGRPVPRPYASAVSPDDNGADALLN